MDIAVRIAANVSTGPMTTTMKTGGHHRMSVMANWNGGDRDRNIKNRNNF
jgi:hypothetical protein